MIKELCACCGNVHVYSGGTKQLIDLSRTFTKNLTKPINQEMEAEQ